MSAEPAPSPAQVIAWREGLRSERLDEAARFARSIPSGVQVVAVVVVGSVARGDFHDRSDIDVLVIAGGLPPDPAERLLALGWPSVDVPRVEPRRLERRGVRRAAPSARSARRRGDPPRDLGPR